jgi:hypothetical protein
MPNYVFAKDRESQHWTLVGTTGQYAYTDYVKGPRGGERKVRRLGYYSKPTKIPENESAFFDAHRVVEAQNEEEAWSRMRVD